MHLSITRPHFLQVLILIPYLPNGLHYLRWGGDGEAVKLGK
jgi:hypothetical protein